MRAVRFYKFGVPATLRIEERATPDISEDEALVQVHAAAINPSDVKNVQGAMKQTTLPRTPGRDFAGVVVKGPSDLVGKEVWGTGGDIGFTRDGSHAQYLKLPSTALYLKPKNIPFPEAAAIGVSYVTAWAALGDAGEVTADDTVVITGANGAVGQAAIQIARWHAARVIGVVRRESQRQIVERLGAEVIDMSKEDLATRVYDLTNGHGASLVFDTVGGEMFEPALKLLAHRGRLLVIATTPNMSRVSFDVRDFYHREARILGVDSLQLNASTAGAILNLLKEGFESGALQSLPIAQQYPLDEAVQAYERVQNGVTGKVVLQM